MKAAARQVGWSLILATSMVGLAGGRNSAATSCLDAVDTLVPGNELNVTAGQSAWLVMQADLDHVYRLAISGTPGTQVELWRADFDEGGQCYTADEMVRSVSLDDTGSVIDLTGWFFNAVRVVPPAGGTGAAVTFEAHEVAAPPARDVLVIPAVAHVRGVGGTLFQTDLVLFNSLGVPVAVDLVLVGSTDLPRRKKTAQLEPRQSVVLDDVVGTLFGDTDTLGALRVESTGGVHATSRTYATSDTGTYGQLVPAQPWSHAAGGNGGPERTLLHLASSAEFRSNVGFVEVLGLDAELDLELVDPNGALLGQRTLILPAGSHLQLNDVFAHLGAASTDSASLRVEILNQARVLVYASVLDNRTSDPIFIPGLVAHGRPLGPTDAGRFLVVPAAAATPGVNGTSWHTDVRVQPVELGDAAVEITYFDSRGGPPRVASFDLAGAGPLALDDVVASLGGEGSGHLVLRSSGPDIIATSRTYTAGSNGTYGQFFATDGKPDGPLEQGMVLGLEGSVDKRTNLGLVNDWEYEVEVELRLFAATGQRLAQRVVTLPAQRRLQINDAFHFFGVPGGRACRLEFEVLPGLGGRRILVHGSVVDNRSGDPSTLPAVRCPYANDCDPPWLPPVE